ncbi:hypothetical protein GCM10010140_60830 [Streptosporangium pseudovulgare]|uniref:HTH cro/C1-type domain-containing protein n=1 Tax=Streptosporangium pseudovulgare TaxID=35765 RepID=A0ABQ2RCM5_9ACTN|nr:hypothetical protein GCM10010140_60830 [Streptosporangium pseudovulgare]
MDADKDPAAENALGSSLRARRARLSPEDVGIPTSGRRRVPGLRREEVATLTGVSSDYCMRLEQGREASASGTKPGTRLRPRNRSSRHRHGGRAASPLTRS